MHAREREKMTLSGHSSLGVLQSTKADAVLDGEVEQGEAPVSPLWGWF
jgi:hypothetical protein